MSICREGGYLKVKGKHSYVSFMVITLLTRALITGHRMLMAESWSSLRECGCAPALRRVRECGCALARHRVPAGSLNFAPGKKKKKKESCLSCKEILC